MVNGDVVLASFPGPARSSLAVRNSHRGPGLVHHVMCGTAYVTTVLLRINDVKHVLALRFTLKEAPKYHSDDSCTSLTNC